MIDPLVLRRLDAIIEKLDSINGKLDRVLQQRSNVTYTFTWPPDKDALEKFTDACSGEIMREIGQ